MSRKVLLSVLLIGILAFGIGMGTYAYFTSQAVSENNVFQSGTLDIADMGAGVVVSELDVDNIYPSWTSGTKTITVTNSGTLPMKYRLSVAPAEGLLYTGDTPLQVSIDGGTFVDIDQLGYVELATNVAAGATDTFTIEFKLPDAANNDYQGATGSFSFVFDAAQVNGQY